MTNATSSDIHKAAEPRSDQLNADSLVSGPITVKVDSVRRGSQEQPIIIELEGHPGRPWKPCKGMLRILIAAWGDDPHVWVGRRMTLVRNPDVKYAGVKVGGIEISSMSDIASDLQLTKTVARGVRAPFIVTKLNDAPEPPKLTEKEQVFVADVRNDIEQADSQEKLTAIAFILKTKSEAVRADLRADYDKRKKELEGTEV